VTRALLLAAATFVAAQALAAQPPPPKDMSIDARTRNAVLDGALGFIDKVYVFPDGAKKLVAAIADKRKQGAYDKITSAAELARTLTQDFDAVLHDRHLHVIYSDRPLPPDRGADDHPTHADLEKMREMEAPFNFGFVRAEVLEGNIGYVRLDGFSEAAIGGEAAAAAMNFVGNTEALIFDLRENHGGDPTMALLLEGYLFEGDPVHVNDFVYRDASRTEQMWTAAWVPGKHYGNKPVFVLTSKQTFSCAEQFSYDLQSQKRAVIVGETTGGGAHPIEIHRLGEHFAVLVPFARALNPVTHKDWEGTGVAPDVSVAADLALAKAKVLALKKLKPRDPHHATVLQRATKDAEDELAKLSKP
jgi:hypothetical protein